MLEYLIEVVPTTIIGAATVIPTKATTTTTITTATLASKKMTRNLHCYLIKDLQNREFFQPMISSEKV